MPYNPLIMYFLYILTLRLIENRARKEDIDVTLLLFDRLKQPIEIIQVAGIPCMPVIFSPISSTALPSLLAAAGDEDICTFLDE